jgi:hypothetical protein
LFIDLITQSYYAEQALTMHECRHELDDFPFFVYFSGVTRKYRTTNGAEDVIINGPVYYNTVIKAA